MAQPHRGRRRRRLLLQEALEGQRRRAAVQHGAARPQAAAGSATARRDHVDRLIEPALEPADVPRGHALARRRDRQGPLRRGGDRRARTASTSCRSTSAAPTTRCRPARTGPSAGPAGSSRAATRSRSASASRSPRPTSAARREAMAQVRDVLGRARACPSEPAASPVEHDVLLIHQRAARRTRPSSPRASRRDRFAYAARAGGLAATPPPATRLPSAAPTAHLITGCSLGSTVRCPGSRSKRVEGSMKKLINEPDAVVREALEGIEAAHADHVRVIHDPMVIVRADAPVQGKVGIISGGGSGHEPMHGGFVGRGHARRGLSRRGLHVADARPDARGDQGRRRRRRRAAHRQELHRRRAQLRDGRRPRQGRGHRGRGRRDQRRRRGPGQPLHRRAAAASASR